MSDVVFDEEFFKKLKEKVDGFLQFFKNNWIWGAAFFIVLIALIFAQQILLFVIH